MNAPVSHFLPLIFPRFLGVVYFLAFASLLVQVPGLYGSRGVLPIATHLRSLREWLGKGAWRGCPTLFWLNSSDMVLSGAALLGVVLALLLVAGVVPPLPLLVLLWFIYFSYVSAGQEFLSYQWDSLLLETGFMTIFLVLADPAPYMAVLAYRFFLFRFMFSAGVVKLTSGDPNWRNLTALCYHYETQPLPNRIGWYVHHLPPVCQKFSTSATFVCELAVPFLALGPEPARLACLALLLFFQALIFATGNYGFFNILTMVLTVPLLDDRHFSLFTGLPAISAPASAGPAQLFVSAMFFIFILLNLCQLVMLFRRPRWLTRLVRFPLSLMISTPYGLFAVMTTKRFEFVIEGSNDLRKWLTYEFRWKPGDPQRPPLQAAPHQPRLDWQMWFAALDPSSIEPWVENLVFRILEGSRPVLALLKRNPFADKPPRFIRLTVFRYRFADLPIMRSEGRWWEREFVGKSPIMTIHEGEKGKRRLGVIHGYSEVRQDAA